MGKFLIIIVAYALGQATGLKTETYSGYAYEIGSKKFIYKETHTEMFENGKHAGTETKYYDSKNKLIAQRNLDFSKSRHTPDFKTSDLLTGYQEGAIVNGNKVRLFVKSNEKEPIREKTLTVPEPFTVDGGFNYYIKDHWSELMEGKVLVFNFTVSSELNYFQLRARLVKDGSVGNDKAKVIVEPNNVMFRWLSDPISITYDMATKRILIYEGKSNLSNNSGKNYLARLIYPEQGP
ncbi:MAG: hypothetical protein M3Q58_12375 [Bacteroidota bacterium]|nr:hypothetical protein [Bacteroidota bacterium]